MEDNVARQTANNANGMATAAFLFALIAAVFAALTYFMLPSLVQKGVENVEAMKVGGPEKYEQLKKIYQDNASVFGEQVNELQTQVDQIHMYQQMQASGSMMPSEEVSGTSATGTMPNESMMMTGDESMSQ